LAGWVEEEPVEAYLQYFDVFGKETNRELYRLAMAKNGLFSQSKTSPNKHYPDWRRSTVIYEDQLGGIIARLHQAVAARLPEALGALGLPPFDIGSFEVQLTSHNDGEYYRWHTDNGTPETAMRVITFVYYFHAVPGRFEGGELVIYPPGGQPLVVEPRNDSLVLFSSRLRHEVKPVACPSRLFEDGRFTLNGWVRRRTATRRDDCFGYEIFAPYAPAARSRNLDAPSATEKESRASGAREGVPGVAAEEAEADAASLEERVAKLESLLRLYGDLHRLSRSAGSIDVLSRITRRRFLERYYCANRPLVLKGRLEGSPALKTWSPEFFRDRFRDVPVQITSGRDRDPDYEKNFRRTVETVTMGEFVERLLRAPETNDFYLVARNHFFDNPAFRPLRDDLRPPPEIIDDAHRSPGSAKLWFGPKGTVTPLHHDEHSILFAQVYGRKHFKLIPSFDLPRLYARARYYSAVDPENTDAKQFPEFLSTSVADVTLGPGDVLFIPVGWWHWVKALDVSISATFCSFRVRGHNIAWKASRS
jgi:Rps23 Pro-64 3,4-dihydroxylase Tpa1-like proline 4-hydroxylase